jgi:hypothetical protein
MQDHEWLGFLLLRLALLLPLALLYWLIRRNILKDRPPHDDVR